MSSFGPTFTQYPSSTPFPIFRHRSGLSTHSACRDLISEFQVSPSPQLRATSPPFLRISACILYCYALMNTSDSDRGTEGTAPRSNEQEPQENGYSVNPPPLVFHPSHSSFSFPENRKKGRNEGISVLATLHTLNNNNRQLNTNISVVKETTSSRKSARIVEK